MRTHVVGSVSRLSYGEKKKWGGGIYRDIYFHTFAVYSSTEMVAISKFIF